MADPRRDSYAVNPEFIVSRTIAAGATAGDYDGRFYVAPFACEIVEVREIHQTAGSSTTASVDVLKVVNGQARASGTSVLAAVVDLSQAASTVQTPALSATLANRRLAENDSLALNNAGTLTAVDGVCVQVYLRPR